MSARKEFLTPPALSLGDSQCGLGIGVTDIGDGQGWLFGHDGKDFGYRASLYYLKRLGITIALCANSAVSPDAEAAYDQLLEQIIAMALESGADGVH